MARIKNQHTYDLAREKLLDVGETLIRQGSYAQIGINDILRSANIPKGSFYHYFESKHAFAMAVATHYHQKQLRYARQILTEQGVAPLQRLQSFFVGAIEDMQSREFGQGCLMCNLTTELADEDATAQAILAEQWNELSNEIALCLRDADLEHIGLAHLTPEEAADWLLNAWSGALTRMKACSDASPLRLFLKTVFSKEN